VRGGQAETRRAAGVAPGWRSGGRVEGDQGSAVRAARPQQLAALDGDVGLPARVFVVPLVRAGFRIERPQAGLVGIDVQDAVHDLGGGIVHAFDGAVLPAKFAGAEVDRGGVWVSLAAGEDR